MRKKIALFAYNFPHKKTQEFIWHILSLGYKIDVIYAADAVQLNIAPSQVKTKISHGGLIHPSEIAKAFGIDYLVMPHNSQELCEDAIERKIDLAVVAGARILKEQVIDCFKLGVINFHPGIIPLARGLDALLWSIYFKNPLGVTAHLIDKRIDAGKILQIKELKVRTTDNIFDLSERLYETQLEMLDFSIREAFNQGGYFLPSYGNYNKKMPADLELKTLSMVDDFTRYFGSKE